MSIYSSLYTNVFKKLDFYCVKLRFWSNNVLLFTTFELKKVGNIFTDVIVLFIIYRLHIYVIILI